MKQRGFEKYVTRIHYDKKILFVFGHHGEKGAPKEVLSTASGHSPALC